MFWNDCLASNVSKTELCIANSGMYLTSKLHSKLEIYENNFKIQLILSEINFDFELTMNHCVSNLCWFQSKSTVCI